MGKIPYEEIYGRKCKLGVAAWKREKYLKSALDGISGDYPPEADG